MYRNTAMVFTASVLFLTSMTSLAVAHGPEKHAGHDQVKTTPATAHADGEHAVRVGDAYPLLTDPVTDEPLAKVKEPVDLIYQGRDLHFANQANADTFKEHPQKYLDKVDAKIIEQQKASYPMTTCVVSGDKLGGDMGEPIDKVYGNRLVRFCCPGCMGDFKKDPAKYLAKIDAAILEANKKHPAKHEVCPVSGEKLGGAMGDPVDYVFAGKVIQFCCKSCIASFEKNPAKYLSKMNHSEHAPAQHDASKHDKPKSDAHDHSHH